MGGPHVPKEETEIRFSLVVAFLVLVKCAVASAPAHAAPVTVSLADTKALPTSAIDQDALSFPVTGASGVAWLGGNDYAVVLDNSNKIVFLTIVLDADGSAVSVTNAGGLSLDITADYEGIAVLSPSVLMVCEETTPGLDTFLRIDGGHGGAVAIPAVYANARANRGLESLEILDGVGWTANEEALSVDGPVASPSVGTTVRLLEFDAATGTPARQLAYDVTKMHGPAIPLENPGQSGLTDLVILPDGRLLALERSFALANPLFLTRIYEIDETGATDVSSLGTLAGATYTPVAKTLAWSGDLGNLEGLTLGPALTGGGHSMIGVADDGDPFSLNQIVFFRVTGITGGECFADCDGTGVLNVDDIECFVTAFLGDDLAADCDASGVLNVDDIECFVDGFLGGCP
ncbi:MAG: hypothetical protein DHS20C14_03970 [Phycisphaeraceae bacterium]|nr:MAG: hypothetical protein DHS20C14_03970 [Phycisphaeraceae bacterium]